MNSTNKNETNWKQPHCESCGRQNPERNDGYTVCCNELVCCGLQKNALTGRVSTGDRFGVEADFVRACCWAHADEQFAAQSRKAPEGSSKLYR